MDLKDRDSASSGGLEDGPDIGVELGAPLRAEAVGDLAEDDAGAQRLFRAVVGRRHRPVGDEDEQVLPVLLDDPEQFLALPVGRLDLEQPVELGFQPCGINGEGGIGEAVAPVADGNGVLQQVLDAGRKADIASVDGVLDIAEQMGKAGLVARSAPNPSARRAGPTPRNPGASRRGTRRPPPCHGSAGSGSKRCRHYGRPRSTTSSCRPARWSRRIAGWCRTTAGRGSGSPGARRCRRWLPACWRGRPR